MRNGKAVGAVFVGLLALGTLGAAFAVAVLLEDRRIVEIAGAVPLAAVLAIVALSLGGHAQRASQRSLGRLGGEGIAGFGRLLGGVALLLAVTGALALGVYAVLALFG